MTNILAKLDQRTRLDVLYARRRNLLE